MKQLSFKTSIAGLRISIVSLILVVLSLFLLSFTVSKITDDFLQQLGITKSKADEKIISSTLGGYLDQYGVTRAKNIALNKRAEVVKDLITYAKGQLNSEAFIKQYSEMRENAKPKQQAIQSPDEMQKQMVEQYRKAVKDIEATVAKADASNKKLFEGLLADARKQLKDAEDPKSKTMEAYRSNYETMLTMNKAAYTQQLEDWEQQYPANHQLFIKTRLQQFLDETEGIDFNAQVTEKNGRKYFVNRAYESKSNRWKMCYRAGKEAVETARQMVQQWMNEIQ